MNNSLNTYTKDLIINSFELEVNTPSEENFVTLLAERVEFLLANRLEFFFVKMYALDIKEDKVHEALIRSEEKPSVAIAKLIIERQLEKQISREKYRQ